MSKKGFGEAGNTRGWNGADTESEMVAVPDSEREKKKVRQNKKGEERKERNEKNRKEKKEKKREKAKEGEVRE